MCFSKFSVAQFPFKFPLNYKQKTFPWFLPQHLKQLIRGAERFKKDSMKDTETIVLMGFKKTQFSCLADIKLPMPVNTFCYVGNLIIKIRPEFSILSYLYNITGFQHKFQTRNFQKLVQALIFAFSSLCLNLGLILYLGPGPNFNESCFLS